MSPDQMLLEVAKLAQFESKTFLVFPDIVLCVWAGEESLCRSVKAALLPQNIWR